MIEVDNDLKTDNFAIKNNYVSITPIHFDLTNYDAISVIEKWGINKLFK